jgi:signal transduction histidine kinase
VRDDGTGFDPAADPGGGFGLTSMRERVELADGELTIEPASGSGMIVRGRIPLG